MKSEKEKTEAVADRLNPTGGRHGNNHPPNSRLNQVVVCEIQSVDTVLQSSGLKVITADCGDQLRRTVSSAANLKVGMKTAFAKLGAVLNNQNYIQIREVSGVECQGSVCSPYELCLGDVRESVIEIPADVAIGTRLSELARA
ncbi:MAG: hypothetical protein GY866_33255 [Proteobacteria bacterium]|nr:hypothetical protein [Pseudomonadota bacterium]